MSAAIDRMAAEAMERLQVRIALQADKARAAITYRAAVMMEAAEARIALAQRCHRAQMTLFECTQRVRTMAAANNYALAMLRETLVLTEGEKTAANALAALGGRATPFLNTKIVHFTSAGGSGFLKPSTNDRRFWVVETSQPQKLSADDTAKIRAAYSRDSDWRNQEDPPGFLLVTLAGIAIAMALGWLGPAIDAQPDRRAEWLLAEQLLHAPGTLASWEAEATAACANVTGDNGAYVRVANGAIYCTDKRGRRLQKAPL